MRLIAATAVVAALALFALRAFAPSPGVPAGADAAARSAPVSAAAASMATAPAQAPQSDRIEPAGRRPPRLVPRPLPPAGSPLVDTFDELKSRADAGDAAAASRLYQDVQRCWRAHEAQSAMANLAGYLPASITDAGIVKLHADESAEIHMLSDLRSLVARSTTLCDGATSRQRDALVPVMLEAARVGDAHAIDCYAGGGFDRMPGLLDHPEWLARMRDDVPRMFDEAIRQGDWVAVELLHHAYAGLFAAAPASQVFTADAALDFRYLSLERLGATGAFVRKLDALLANAARGLTPQQLADADAWARDAYAQYFSGSSSNEVANGANICGPTYE